MCVPTVVAVAVTDWNEEHVRFAHTVNVRMLPGLGGPAGCGAARVGAAAAADRASTAAAAVRVVVRSRKGEDSPKVPAVDCGTRRYSAESMAERFAANVTHPESAAGSSVVSRPIDSATWDASAELHEGSAGAEVLEQPAAVRTDHTTRCTALRRFMPTSALAWPASCSGPDVHPQLHAAGAAPPTRRDEPQAAHGDRAPGSFVVPAVAHVDARTSFRSTRAPTSTSPYMHTISGPVGKSPSSEIHRPRIDARAPEPHEM